MNLDFVLGKNDSNEAIIVKLRKSPTGAWMQFAEDDRLLAYHQRLKILPKSKQNFKENRNVKCKFVPKKVAELYYDFSESRFKFVDNYLTEYQEPAKAEPVRLADDSAERELERLKFNSVYHSITYFLMRFKTLTDSYSENVRKFYLKKVFHDLPDDTFEQPISELYLRLFLMFDGQDLPFKREFRDFRSDHCADLKEYLTKLFDYLEKIFPQMTEKQRIASVIKRLPETLTAGLEYSNDHRVINNKRFFTRFLIYYANANNVQLNFRHN